MPATRLLVVADPKMLAALANGLRISGRFEIETSPFADPATLLPLTANAEVVALFYGSRAWPLPGLVRELAAGVRARGARLVAVLQKDQALLRDDCFRAGASDLLFMPMPKDLFSARLFESASLFFAEDEGLKSAVSLSRNGQPAALFDATIGPGGLTIAGGPLMQPGESVQVSWQASIPFSRWGLVAQSGAGGVRIRFAGVSADEDAQVRAWLKGQPIPPLSPIPERIASSPSVAPLTADAKPPAAAEIPATVADVKIVPPTVLEVKAVAPTVVEVKAIPPTVVDLKAIPPTLVEMGVAEGPLITPTGSARITPSSPGAAVPPGFAARPPIRPQSIRTNPGMGPAKPRSIDTAPGSPSETGEHRPVASVSNPGTGPAAITPAKGLTPVSGSRASTPIPSNTVVGDAGSSAQAPVAAAPTSPAAASVSGAGTGPASPGAAIASPPKGTAPVSTAAAPPIASTSPVSAASPAATPDTAGKDAPLAAKSSGLDSLFEEPSTTGSGSGAPPPVEMEPLPNWPTPLDPALARSLLTLMLKEKVLPSDAPADPAAAVRKVFGTLPSIDREALEAAAADSHLHEALISRVQLTHANAEGQVLCEKGLGALVDDAAVTALLKITETASKRLQAEADRAIAKGEVEALQQVTASSAALSRELLSFKETVDRLHGLALAPRLGAGALDPTMVAPDAPKAAVRKDKSEARIEQRKLALSDFTGLQNTPQAAKQKRWLVIGLVLLAVSIGNALWFALPQVKDAAAPMIEQAGTGVLGVTFSNTNAIVSISPIWTQAYDRKARVQSICDTLAPKGVKKAMIYVEGKGMIGQVDITRCEAIGLPQPKPPPPELGGPALPGGK